MSADPHAETERPVLDQDFMQDPQRLYAHLRAEGPA